MSTTPPSPKPDRLFGTDGIRGRAGEGALAPDSVARIGKALAQFAREQTGQTPARVLVAGDPRPSTPTVVARLTGAMLAEQALVMDMGIVPTPVLAWGTVAGEYDLGVMVSASHNPVEDNGIKPFHATGRKLTGAEEARIEALIAAADPAAEDVEPPRDVKARFRYTDATVQWLAEAGRLDGMRVVVDLAGGAATTVAPDVLRGLGAEVELLHPAGERAINDACGTQHPDAWLAAIADAAPSAGIAFDGDADRVLLASPEGEILDGDDMLSILAEHALSAGGVPANTVVSTVMSNLGLEERLAAQGLRLERAGVGDRQVANRMRETGAAMGGEPSGHIVLPRSDLDDPPLIGDAAVAAVRVLQAARGLDASLSTLRARRPRYPQTLVGVRVDERVPIEEWPALAAVIESQEAEHAGVVRLVIRYSGTEPLLRIMAEGKDPDAVERAVKAIETVALAGA